jgi:hypothetical protein
MSCPTVTIHFFLFFCFENMQMSHHSGTTICRLASIWHMPYNMYLIIRVISNNGKHKDTIIILLKKHIYT